MSIKNTIGAIIGFAAIGGIAVPGMINGLNAMDHVDIAMTMDGVETKIGVYDCGSRRFNPSAGSTLDDTLTMDWADEREVAAAMSQGNWIGDLMTDAMFDRFDEICDAR